MHNTRFIPIFLIVIISVLLDWYFFQGLKVLTSSFSNIESDNISTIFLLFSSSIILIFFYNFYRVMKKGKFSTGNNIVFNAFITLFVTKLAFVSVLLIEDIYRIVAGLVDHYPQRSITWSLIALAISLIPFFAFIFGVTRGKYHYKVRRTKLKVPNLPAEFEGFTISHISDIHSGSLDSVSNVQRGVNLINAQKSDLFVFTGDLVNNKATEIEPWIPIFSQIQAKSGKYSVLGNHDYGDYVAWNNPADKAANLNRLKSNHKKLGFRLLLDEHVKIEKGGKSIDLIGIENWGLGFGQRGNLKKALQGTESNNIKVLLSHDPSHWDAEVKNNPQKIDLTLSGHTHGMQFGIEFLGFKWSPVKYRYRNWAGLATNNDRNLYVNRGFGFIGFSGRVGIWPEITVIEFTAG